MGYDKRDRVGIVTLSRRDARNSWGSDDNEGLTKFFENEVGENSHGTLSGNSVLSISIPLGEMTNPTAM